MDLERMDKYSKRVSFICYDKLEEFDVCFYGYFTEELEDILNYCKLNSAKVIKNPKYVLINAPNCSNEKSKNVINKTIDNMIISIDGIYEEVFKFFYDYFTKEEYLVIEKKEEP